MSDDLISRQAEIDAIVNRETTTTRGTEYLDGYAKCQHDILDIIDQLPSAQPEGCPFYIGNKHDRGDDSLCGLFHREVKYLAIETRQVGEWIDDNCSLCGQYVHHGDARNYCPNCGAIMVEGGSK